MKIAKPIDNDIQASTEHEGRLPRLTEASEHKEKR